MEGRCSILVELLTRVKEKGWVTKPTDRTCASVNHPFTRHATDSVNEQGHSNETRIMYEGRVQWNQ